MDEALHYFQIVDQMKTMIRATTLYYSKKLWLTSLDEERSEPMLATTATETGRWPALSLPL